DIRFAAGRGIRQRAGPEAVELTAFSAPLRRGVLRDQCRDRTMRFNESRERLGREQTPQRAPADVRRRAESEQLCGEGPGRNSLGVGDFDELSAVLIQRV